MTFRSRTLRTIAIVIAVMALGAPAAFATQMTPQEQQVIASRGVGAPTPNVVLPKSSSVPADTARATSSSGTDWGAIAGFSGAAIAACLALLALSRRRTTATPR